MTYAMSGKKTLLVDFDLRRPRLGRMFGVISDTVSDRDRSRSLVDALAAEAPVSFDALPIPSGYDNLELVVSRSSTQISPATVMGSDTLRQFFAWAREHYEHVVIDSPPFGLVSDALALGALSDSVILVCRPERSRYRAIRHALRSLLESGSRVLGVIVNDVDFKGGGSFGSYHYARNYGYNYYGKNGRYGRYGYGYGYYHRGIAEEAGRAESADGDQGTPSATPASSVLDVDDDES